MHDKIIPYQSLTSKGPTEGKSRSPDTTCISGRIADERYNGMNWTTEKILMKDLDLLTRAGDDIEHSIAAAKDLKI